MDCRVEGSLVMDPQAEDGLAMDSQAEDCPVTGSQDTAIAAIELSVPYGEEDGSENPFLTDSDSEASPNPTTTSAQLPANTPLALSSQPDLSNTICVYAPFVSDSELRAPRLEGVSLAELVYMTAEALPKFTNGDSISPASAVAFYKRADGEWTEAVEWDEELGEDVTDICLMHRLQSIIDRGSEIIQAVEPAADKPIASSAPSVAKKPMAGNADLRDGFLKKAFKRLILKQPQPAPIPITVSLCTPAVFGRPLETLQLPQGQQYPLFITETLAILDRTEPCEGMFRLNGSHSAIGRLRALIDEGASIAEGDALLAADAHSLCGLLKLYLRLLPGSLLAANGLYSAWTAVGSLIEAGSTGLAYAASRFLIETAMPVRHRSLLVALLDFLRRRMLPAEAVTRMSASNLAACIGPNLIRRCPDAETDAHGTAGSDIDSSMALGQELVGSTLGGTLLRFLLLKPERAEEAVVVGLGRMLYDLHGSASSISSLDASPGPQSDSDVMQAEAENVLSMDTASLPLSDTPSPGPLESRLQEGTLVFLTSIADTDNEEGEQGILDGWWHGFSCTGAQACNLSRIPHNYLTMAFQCNHPRQLL
jgi:hypothetical protein